LMYKFMEHEQNLVVSLLLSVFSALINVVVRCSLFVGRLESWKVGKLENWKVGKLESWKIGKFKKMF
jgi:hypothetical protein